MIFAILIDFQKDLEYEHGKNCYMYVKLKIIEAIGFGLLYIHAGVTIILFTRKSVYLGLVINMYSILLFVFR